MNKKLPGYKKIPPYSRVRWTSATILRDLVNLQCLPSNVSLWVDRFGIFGIFQFVDVVFDWIEPKFAVSFIDGIDLGTFWCFDAWMSQNKFSTGGIEGEPMNTISNSQDWKFSAKKGVYQSWWRFHTWHILQQPVWNQVEVQQRRWCALNSQLGIDKCQRWNQC